MIPLLSFGLVHILLYAIRTNQIPEIIIYYDHHIMVIPSNTLPPTQYF